jgi:acetyl-CoA acyltransferase
MTTVVDALEQRDGRYSLQTMCEGGGMANAISAGLRAEPGY